MGKIEFPATRLAYRPAGLSMKISVPTSVLEASLTAKPGEGAFRRTRRPQSELDSCFRGNDILTRDSSFRKNDRMADFAAVRSKCFSVCLGLVGKLLL